MDDASLEKTTDKNNPNPRLSTVNKVGVALNSVLRSKAASEGDQMYCVMKTNGERFAQ
jgi:hypothetical protein